VDRLVLLDSGPLGMVTNPKASPETEFCRLWLETLLTQNVEVIIPEIADYEVRRELLRAKKLNGIKRLDELKNILPYLTINTLTMLKAAEFWSQARQMGKPTANNEALDGDVILAAQAFLLKNNSNQVIVATTNVKHLSLFVDAREWRSIK
jgi:hypothetical protein